MTDNPTPLDPDEITCRKCLANPGEVCRQPNGDKARTIHAVRRRDAADGNPPAVSPVKTPSKMRTKPKTSSTFDSDKASAAGRKSAQERRRRRAEAEAALEAKREEAQRRKVEEEAERLAADALRFERDRAILKRHVLDGALKAYAKLIEGLDGLQRVELDDDGRPCLTPREFVNARGDRGVRDVPDVRGAYSAEHVERIAKVAASALNSLRLEEGKPTGINRNEGGDQVAEALGEAGVRDLVEWASQNLRESS